jgi:DNA-binding transcriptional regulator YiaG
VSRVLPTSSTVHSKFAPRTNCCQPIYPGSIVRQSHSTQNHCSNNDDSLEDNRPTRKPKKKPKTSGSYKTMSDFCCGEHGPNNAHDTKDCKFILDRLGESKKRFRKASTMTTKQSTKRSITISSSTSSKWKQRRRRPNGPRLSTTSSSLA